jgi:hypothetical protein
MDPEVVVFAAGFQQHHAGIAISRKPVGEHAPRRAGTDDDVVVIADGIRSYADMYSSTVWCSRRTLDSW